MIGQRKVEGRPRPRVLAREADPPRLAREARARSLAPEARLPPLARAGEPPRLARQAGPLRLALLAGAVAWGCAGEPRPAASAPPAPSPAAATTEPDPEGPPAREPDPPSTPDRGAGAEMVPEAAPSGAAPSPPPAPAFALVFASPHRGRIVAVAVDEARGRTVTMTSDGVLSLRDASGAVRAAHRFARSADGPGTLLFSPDGRVVSVRVPDGLDLHWMLGPDVLEHDGDAIARAYGAGTLTAYVVGATVCVSPRGAAPDACATRIEVGRDVDTLVFSPDETMIAALTPTEVRLVDLSARAVRHRIRRPGSACLARFSPDGQALVVAYEAGPPAVLDAAAGRLRGPARAPDDWEDDYSTRCLGVEIRFSEDGGHAASRVRAEPWRAVELETGDATDLPEAFAAALGRGVRREGDALVTTSGRVPLLGTTGERSIHQIELFAGGLLVRSRGAVVFVDARGARALPCAEPELEALVVGDGPRFRQEDGVCDARTGRGTRAPAPPDLDPYVAYPAVPVCPEVETAPCLRQPLEPDAGEEGAEAPRPVEVVSRVRRRVLRTLPGTEGASDVAVSPDGTLAAVSFHASGTTRFFRVATGAPVREAPMARVDGWALGGRWAFGPGRSGTVAARLDAPDAAPLVLSTESVAVEPDTARVAYATDTGVRVLTLGEAAAPSEPERGTRGARALRWVEGSIIDETVRGVLRVLAPDGTERARVTTWGDDGPRLRGRVTLRCAGEEAHGGPMVLAALPGLEEIGRVAMACPPDRTSADGIDRPFAVAADGRFVAIVESWQSVALVRVRDGARLWVRISAGGAAPVVVAQAEDGAFWAEPRSRAAFALRDRRAPMPSAPLVSGADADGLYRPTLLADFFEGRPLPAADGGPPPPLAPDTVAAGRSLAGYPPESAFDGVLETGWAVRDATADDFLEARFDAPTHVARLSMSTGYEKRSAAGDLFVLNAHLRRVRIETDRGVTEHDVAEDQRRLELVVGGPITHLRVVPLAVWPGTRWQDLTLSEVEMLSE